MSVKACHSVALASEELQDPQRLLGGGLLGRPRLSILAEPCANSRKGGFEIVRQLRSAPSLLIAPCFCFGQAPSFPASHHGAAL
jgi:hypothetical protein